MPRNESFWYVGSFAGAAVLGAALLASVAEARLSTGGIMLARPRGPARSDMPSSTAITVYSIPSAVAYGLPENPEPTHFDVTDAPHPGATTLTEMNAEGRLLLLTTGGASWLTPKAEAFQGIRAIDGALLEHALRDLEGVQVDYQHGVEEVQEALAEGRAHSAVLIRPVSIEEIERTGREGLLMPPKSTFFTPKLRTGLVVRPLD